MKANWIRTEMCLPFSIFQSLNGRWKSPFGKNWNVSFRPVVLNHIFTTFRVKIIKLCNLMRIYFLATTFSSLILNCILFTSIVMTFPAIIICLLFTNRVKWYASSYANNIVKLEMMCQTHIIITYTCESDSSVSTCYVAAKICTLNLPHARWTLLTTPLPKRRETSLCHKMTVY